MEAKQDRSLRCKQKKFVYLYSLALIIAFSPSKALGQFLPLIFFTGLIFWVGIRPNYHLKKLALLVIAYAVIGLFYWILLPEFWFLNYFLFFVTISSVFLLILDFSLILSQTLLLRLGKITFAIIFLESLYGLVQAFYGYSRAGGRFDSDVGDIVWGTLAPPFNTQVYSGNSPFFIILISCLLMFVLAISAKKISILRFLAYILIFLCWLLASLLHSLLYFAVALIIAILVLAFSSIKVERMRNGYVSVKSRGTKGIAVLLFAMAFLFSLGFVIHPNNFARISRVLVSLTEIGPDAHYRKLRVIYFTLIEIPDTLPIQPLLGVGPGQYASRAALMASGQYLKRASLPLPVYAGSFASEYILPFIGFGTSSNHFPSSSWIALYGEMGAVGLIIALFVFAKYFNRFRKYRSYLFPRMNLAMLTLLLYIGLMGLQNVYWEYTQAIFVPLLTLRLGYQYLKYERDLARRADFSAYKKSDDILKTASSDGLTG